MANLATYQTAGPISSTLAWNSTHQAKPNISNIQYSSDSIRLPIAPNQTESSRGEFSEDPCITIDLFANSGMMGCIWSERKVECTITTEFLKPIVNYNAQEQNKPTIIKECNRHSIAETYCPLINLNSIDKMIMKEDEMNNFSSVACISLLLTSCANHAAEKAKIVLLDSDNADNNFYAKGKKGKKGKKRFNNSKLVTIVCPCGFTQSQIAMVLEAARQSGLTVKNLFNRGLATITGTLYLQANRQNQKQNCTDKTVMLKAALATYNNNEAKTHIVLYLNLYSLPQPSNDGTLHSILYYDAALVRCEGSKESQRTGGLLGYERMCTLATMGDKLCRDDKDENALVIEFLKVLSTVVDSLIGLAVNVKIGDVSVVLLDGLLITNKVKGKSSTSSLLESKISDLWSKTMTTTTRGEEDKEDIGDISFNSAMCLSNQIAVVAAAMDTAAVIGGCLLSAAELDSSKQYIQIRTKVAEESSSNNKLKQQGSINTAAAGMYEEQLTIAHMLPIADGVVQGGDIGLRILWNQAMENDCNNNCNDDSVTLLYRTGTRVWKEDLGVIRRCLSTDNNGSSDSNDNEMLSTVIQFQWGSSCCTASIPSSSSSSLTKSQLSSPSSQPPLIGWPKVQLLQRLPLYKGWTVIKTLLPLVDGGGIKKKLQKKEKALLDSNNSNVDGTLLDSNDENSGDIKTQQDAFESVESCSLEILVDPATGIIVTSQKQGNCISETRKNYWRWAQLIFVLLLPFLLIAAYYLFTMLYEQYITAQHVAWLNDFYMKNAPEKLRDPDYVVRTIKKYKGRMFLLWRGLERTYQVKWAPPISIIDDISA